MAINPLSSSFPTPDPLLTSAAAALSTALSSPAPAPSLQALQAMEASALDPMLVDPSTSASANQTGSQDPLLSLLEGGTPSSGDPLLSSFNSMTGSGDPLLDGLNSLDSASVNGLNPTNAATAEDAALNQDLTSFLVQQASSRYSAAQILGSSTQPPKSGSTGALGNTSA